MEKERKQIANTNKVEKKTEKKTHTHNKNNRKKETQTPRARQHNPEMIHPECCWPQNIA